MGQWLNGAPMAETNRNRWSSGFTPQYGKHRDIAHLRGMEQRQLDKLNSKQTTERWKVERSVTDGPTGPNRKPSVSNPA